jgi:myo-inositol-1(or 4)-monophosphatase
MDEAILTAWNSARSGSAALLDGLEKRLSRRGRRPPDEASEARKRSEAAVRALIGEAFPDHRILSASEKAESPGLEENVPVWLVNALDGVHDYKRGSPFFSVTVGFAVHDGKALKPLIGVVMAPALMEMFWASLGGGAHYCRQIPGIGLVEGPIGVSRVARASRAVVKTEINPNLVRETDELDRQTRLQREVLSFSRESSSALNMAYVASGRAECFYSSALNPVTALPAGLIVTEAGGRVGDYLGRPYLFNGGWEMLAANETLHGRFVELLNGLSKVPGKVALC